MQKAPKGTRDVLPDISYQWIYIEKIMREVASCFGFSEVRTPTFEATELFLRGVGDTTDIVKKEMYTFLDKGKRSMTLKPEGTAGAVRALIESTLYAGPLPVKMYYLNNPIFRYENPQSGRLREHHQFGVECFGAPSADADVEIIALAMRVLAKLGIQGLAAHINSIGCPVCRPIYQQKLREYLAGKLGHLCPDCHERYEKNPLRILDCKVPSCKEQLTDAPVSIDYLCEDCAVHFQALQSGLTNLSIPFTVDTGIVRGLDYYTRTVFEIVADIGGGLTMCGGGRYDGLVEEIGGPKTPAVGFGMGMERLLMVLDEQGIALPDETKIDIYIAALPDGMDAARKLLYALRERDIKADMDLLGRSLKAQFKQANRLKVPFVLIVGGDELMRSLMRLRDMNTGSEREIGIQDIDAVLEDIKGGIVV